MTVLEAMEYNALMRGFSKREQTIEQVAGSVFAERRPDQTSLTNAQPNDVPDTDAENAHRGAPGSYIRGTELLLSLRRG